MTCREKLAQEYPEKIDPGDPGGCKGCPDTYNYLDMPPEDMCGALYCRDCWDREIPGTLPSQYKIDTEAEAELAKPDPMWTKENPHILDSGDRTEFATGAVRDMREGKGRCDLMPLEVVAKYLRMFKSKESALPIEHIACFQKDGSTDSLYYAIHWFAMHNDMLDTVFTMFLEVAKHFEEGAKKYGENNWQKGIPAKCYIDSAVRHYLKWLRGDKDEPHDRAFVWNLMCCIWEVDYSPRAKENVE